MASEGVEDLQAGAAWEVGKAADPPAEDSTTATVATSASEMADGVESLKDALEVDKELQPDDEAKDSGVPTATSELQTTSDPAADTSLNAAALVTSLAATDAPSVSQDVLGSQGSPFEPVPSQGVSGTSEPPGQVLTSESLSDIPDGILGIHVSAGPAAPGGAAAPDVDVQLRQPAPGSQPFASEDYSAAGAGPMQSMMANSTITLEEDASGDLSASSTETLTLTSTVSRGNYHQCGSARRVKVYELKGENWFDRGTGYCAGVYDETSDEALLVARKEDKCQFLEGVDNQAEFEEDLGVDRPDSGQELGSGGGSKQRPCKFVVVVSENLDTEDVLLASKVVREEVYQKQQDTLVVWTEPEGADMALSFQEPEGCSEVWEFLTEVQKHFARLAEEALSDSPPMAPNQPSPPGTLGMSGSGFSLESFVGPDGAFVGLPDPELRNLDSIEVILKEAATQSPIMREKVAIWLLREQYIKKLIPVFEDAEELEALPSLHLLCLIMQTILMLNDNVVFEYILQDEIFLGVVGMLEYDPEFPRLKASYRDYLRDKARFKQIVEIADPIIVAKIHQTYRLLYLKDVILARVLDDPTFSILNSFVFFHQSDIVSYCSQNETFLPQLFGLLANPEESDEQKSEGILFLQQLCAMGKQIQLPARLGLYRTLMEHGLLRVVQYALQRLDQHIRNAAAEILMTSIEYDANGVRSHVVAQRDRGERPLISMLIDLLHVETDLGLKAQMAEALRIIFDVGEGGPMAAQAQLLGGAVNAVNAKAKADSDRFLAWIYETEIARLCSPFNALPDMRVLSKGEKLATQPRPRSALYGHLCDLLCYMIVHHTFRSQYFVLTSEVSKKVGSLLHSREKHIRLSALRFFKHCLASNNQFTNRHFIKIELFSTILGLVESEADRNNLVCSACLDFFEQIRRANMKQLISHCMEKHGPRMRHLAAMPHVGACFAAIALQWEKNTELVDASEGDASAVQAQAEEKARQRRDLARRGATRTDVDLEEESYFNTEDEDENEAGSSSGSGSGPMAAGTVGLVPYDDDDDDDDDDADAEMAASGDASVKSPPESPPKLSEKRRREEEQEEEDMVGRLAKRKNGKSKTKQQKDGSGGRIDQDSQEPGGFIRTMTNTISSPFRMGSSASMGGRDRGKNNGGGSTSPSAAAAAAPRSAHSTPTKNRKPKGDRVLGDAGTSPGPEATSASVRSARKSKEESSKKEKGHGSGNGSSSSGGGGGGKKILLGLSSSSKMAAQSGTPQGSSADTGSPSPGKK